MLKREVQELADLNWHRAMRGQTQTYRQGQLSKPRLVILIFHDSGFLSIYDDFRASFFLQVLLAGVEPKGCTLPSLSQVLTQVHFGHATMHTKFTLIAWDLYGSLGMIHKLPKYACFYCHE